MRTLLLPLLLSVAAVPALAGDVVWQKSLEQALAKAQAENKPVFLAVNMDGERANDYLANKTYKERSFLDYSTRTVNALASAQEHTALGKPCNRFSGLECIDHRRTDTAARGQVLKADSEGSVIAPQHVWIAPDGKLLFSVAYSITLDELNWCMVTALREVDPKTDAKMPSNARAPRRLVLGGVFDPSGSGDGTADLPPTRQEVLDIIKELKKSWMGLEQMGTARRLLMSAEPEALEFVRQQLRGSIGSLLGGGGGGGGAGCGRGGAGAGGRGAGGGDTFKAQILHQIGIVSPPEYWELVVESLGHNDQSVRIEAAVALEQLAAPESLRALNIALQKEDDLRVKKDLLRAIGSVGALDSKSRGALIKRGKSDKDDTLRLNSIAALAFSTQDGDVSGFLQQSLVGKDPRARTAAACAVGLSRDKQFIEVLEAQVVQPLAETADPLDQRKESRVAGYHCCQKSPPACHAA
jgi:hypothetical protein